MITLTSPPAVNSILGGAGTVSYDRFVLQTITYDTVNLTVNAVIRITSTTNPDMQAITGRLVIQIASAKLEIQVEQLDFYRRITLTGPQNTSIETLIRNAQNAIENGLITVGVIAGTQATGS